MHNRDRGFYKNGGYCVKGYFLTVLIAAVCGAVCVILSWGGFEKYIKYIVSLVCVSLIILPLREIDLSGIEKGIAKQEISVYESDTDYLYALSGEITEKRAEEYISELVFLEFGIKKLSADIKIDWESETPTVESICVGLSKDDIDKCEEVRGYLTSVLGGEVRVIES